MKNENNININISDSKRVTLGDVTITNNLNMNNDDQEKLLEQIHQLIESNGTSIAKDYFTSFKEELEKPEPKKSMLDLFWNSMKTAVPLLGQTVGIVSKVAQLLA